MHLAPLMMALNAVLAGLPLAIAEKLDAGAVDQPTAQGRVNRHRPVKARHVQQAGDRPCRHAARARSSPCPARSAVSRACMGPQCSWTSSSCGGARVQACSCRASNRIDSRCESRVARVLQQRRPIPRNNKRFPLVGLYMGRRAESAVFINEFNDDWRMRWDSNPRNLSVRWFSRPVP